MQALDPIRRKDFRLLADLSDSRLRQALHHRFIVPWRSAAELTALDVVAYRVSKAYADAYGWPATRHFVPAISATLPDGLDSARGHVAIAITGPTSFLVATGPDLESALALVGAGKRDPVFATPIDPAVDDIRAFAKKHGIPLPEKFAPPPGILPTWAKGNPAWRQQLGAATIELQPATAGARVAAH